MRPNPNRPRFRRFGSRSAMRSKLPASRVPDANFPRWRVRVQEHRADDGQTMRSARTLRLPGGRGCRRVRWGSSNHARHPWCRSRSTQRGRRRIARAAVGDRCEVKMHPHCPGRQRACESTTKTLPPKSVGVGERSSWDLTPRRRPWKASHLPYRGLCDRTARPFAPIPSGTAEDYEASALGHRARRARRFAADFGRVADGSAGSRFR